MRVEKPFLGAVVFAGSQAVDFVNGRIGRDSGERVQRRAHSYEAELLKCARAELLNECQREVLRRFPRGFDPQLGYSYRDVRASQA